MLLRRYMHDPTIETVTNMTRQFLSRDSIFCDEHHVTAVEKIQNLVVAGS